MGMEFDDPLCSSPLVQRNYVSVADNDSDDNASDEEEDEEENYVYVEDEDQEEDEEEDGEENESVHEGVRLLANLMDKACEEEVTKPITVALCQTMEPQHYLDRSPIVGDRVELNKDKGVEGVVIAIANDGKCCHVDLDLEGYGIEEFDSNQLLVLASNMLAPSQSDVHHDVHSIENYGSTTALALNPNKRKNENKSETTPKRAKSWCASVGVTFTAESRYKATIWCREESRKITLGTFDTEPEASDVYQKKLAQTARLQYSAYVGVTRESNWRDDCPNWKAQIKVDGKTIHLGNFQDEISAAKAYDEECIKHGRAPANVDFLDVVESL